MPERNRPERVVLAQRVSVSETNGPEEITVDGVTTPVSFLLRRWVERLGGYVGEITDEEEPPFIYPVSLENWRSRDLDETWLKAVAVVQYRLRGRGNQHTPPGVVIASHEPGSLHPSTPPRLKTVSVARRPDRRVWRRPPLRRQVVDNHVRWHSVPVSMDYGMTDGQVLVFDGAELIWPGYVDGMGLSKPCSGRERTMASS